MQNRFLILWNAHILLESLPISSSGHLILINNLLAKIKKEKPLIINTTTEQLMHIPTAFIISLALLIYGFSTIIHGSLLFNVDFFSELIFSWLIAAIISNGITGFFYILKRQTFFLKFPVWLGFLITSIFLLSLYALSPGITNSITIKDGVYIGFSQSLALLPGISRMATTTATALWLGIAPLSSILFSLLLELGLIIAAFLKIWFEESNKVSASIGELMSKALWSILFSSFLSLFLLVLIIKSTQAGHFKWFGWYMFFISLITYFYTHNHRDLFRNYHDKYFKNY